MANLKDIDLLKIGNTIQLVGAVWAGEGKAYLAMFPDSNGHVFPFPGDGEVVLAFDSGADECAVDTLDMDRDDWETFLRQTDLLETEILAEAADKSLTKTILRKSSRQIDQGVSWQVFKRDNYTCRYCGNDDTPLTVDHLVTWESGGPSTLGNLVAADRRCNKTRGNLPYDQWLKHPYYKKVSVNLTETQRQENLLLLETLDQIPRRLHRQSR